MDHEVPRAMSAPVLSANAQRVLEGRYLRRDATRAVIETPAELSYRRNPRKSAAAATEPSPSVNSRTSTTESAGRARSKTV